MKLSTKNSMFGKQSWKVREKLRYSKIKVEEFITTRAALQKMVTGILQVEMKKKLDSTTQLYEEIKISRKGNYMGKCRSQYYIFDYVIPFFISYVI